MLLEQFDVQRNATLSSFVAAKKVTLLREASDDLRWETTRDRDRDRERDERFE